MWGKIIIPVYRLWLNGLYGLYGPRCPLSSKRPINLIFLSLTPYSIKIQRDFLINSKIKKLAIDASRQFSLMVKMRNFVIFSYYLACISQENKNIKKSLCIFLKHIRATCIPNFIEIHQVVAEKNLSQCLKMGGIGHFKKSRRSWKTRIAT